MVPSVLYIIGGAGKKPRIYLEVNSRMRMLMLHVDHFRTELTEKSRSKLVEEVDNKTVAVEEALVLWTSVEKSDEPDPDSVVRKAEEEIIKCAEQLKVRTLVLHSFAHLFGELARPEVGLAVLKAVQNNLQARGYVVHRTPFGWFNTMELKAKGHPLSRMARTIGP